MIALHVPLKKEAEPLLAKFIDKTQRSKHGRVFHEGRLGEKNCVLLIGGLGPKRAQASLEKLLELYPCDKVVHCGTAGSLSDTLKIGDLIVAQNFSDPGLLQAALKIGQEWSIQVGNIVSVEHDVTSSRVRENLYREHKALAVDQESETCANVCAVRKVPLLVVRVISDQASTFVYKEFHQNLEKVSQRLADYVERLVAVL